MGPGPVEAQIVHSEAFVAACGLPPPQRVLDLGSGAGVPGLVLASRWPGAQVVLVDAGQRRAAFLAEAVEELGLGDHVEVVWGRAEEAARRPDLRATIDVVTARGFGPPTVTAECAAGFLVVGGRLLVSEPPFDEKSHTADRWPPSALTELGLQDDGLTHHEPAIRRLRQVRPCPDRYPRRVGIPAKRPL